MSAIAIAPTPEERAALQLGYRGLAAIGVTVLLFAGWVATAPLAATAVSEGVVKTDRNRRVVQHQEGGIVSEIRVRDGDRVRAGQVLIGLDDPSVRAELRKVRSMLDSELASRARLEAERALAVRFDAPAELLARREDPAVSEILAREQRVFLDRRGALDAQVALIRDSIAEVEHEVLALQGQAQATAAAAQHMSDEVATNEKLLKDNFVQKTRVSALQRSLNEYQMKESEANAEIARARQRKLDQELRARALRNQFSQDADAELKRTADRIEQLRAQLEPNSEALRRQQIAAPVTGRVVELRVNTIGAVISPRETILEIVPDDAPLLVEARLRTDAIAQVSRGTQAGVRLLAFDQRSTPTLDGTVTYVSADRQIDKANGASYYVIQVEIKDAALKASGVESLTPGMPAEVYLRAGKRTALSYLIDPFVHRMQSALREK